MSDTLMGYKIPRPIEQAMHVAEDKELQKKLLNLAAYMYRSFMQERYKKYSGGGGDWKPLAKATKKARRKGKGGGSDRILIDTGGLIQAVGVMTHVGATNEINGSWITVGFSTASHSAGLTYNRIASMHNFGEGFVPRRSILVTPTSAEKEEIRLTLLKEWQKWWDSKRK